MKDNLNSRNLKYTPRPQWDEPCDELGNPINEDGTVQAYAIKACPCPYYVIKNIKFTKKE